MKTIEQLLQLSKNPYYQFTPEEKAILDDFLFRKREETGKNLQKHNGKNLETNTNVRVRNIVPKTIDRPEDAPEPSEVA